MNLIIAIFFIGGLIIWKHKREFLPWYSIYLTTFGLILLEYTSPSIDAQELLDAFTSITRITSILLIACTIFNIFLDPQKQSFFYDTRIYWIWILIGGLYFIFWEYIQGRNSGGGITYSFLSISILPIYYRSISFSVKVSFYKKNLIAISFIEALIVVFCLFVSPLYLPQILSNEQFLISGSFYRFNALASFLAMTGIIASFAYFYEQMKAKHYLIFMITIVAGVLVTGARMQFVWMCIAIFMIALSNYKANKKLCIGMFSTAVILFIIIQSINLRGYSSRDAQSGLERQFYGIVSAINGKSAESGNQTQDISTYMLEHYFHRSPFIGNGIGDRIYSYHPQYETKVMMGDAAFAFIIVEYGIFGLFFALAIYFSAFNVIKKGMLPSAKKKANILFASLFVITITESGFFDFTLMSYVWTYMAWLKYKERESYGQIQQ